MLLEDPVLMNGTTGSHMAALLYCSPFSVETDAFKQIEAGVVPISGLSGLGRLSTLPQSGYSSLEATG